MNKLAILSLCTVFALAVLISSCSKTLDQPGNNGFRCAFGKQEFIADSAYYKTRQAGVLGTNIVVYAGGVPKFRFYLTHNSTSTYHADTIGTYALDSTINQAYFIDNDSTTYRSINGSLVISQYYNDSLKVLSGTFSFDGREPGSSGRTLNFSYGYFNNIPRSY